MDRLPRVRDLRAEMSGWGFFVCARKELRAGRGGDQLALVLQDGSGQIAGRVLQDVSRLREEFDAGEFVKVHGRASLYNGRLELLVERIRRVLPAQDRLDGFNEDDLIPTAPRSVDEMWAELETLVGEVANPAVRSLLVRVLADHGERLRLWPAAVSIHHAYRGGLLEHVLQVARAGRALASLYDADPDLVVAGAVLHDIGKLRELEYDAAAAYSVEGNLLGHIAIGVAMVREAARSNRRLSGFASAADRAPGRLASRQPRARIAGRADDRRGLHPGRRRRSRRPAAPGPATRRRRRG